MVLGYKVLHARGQKLRLVDLPGTKCLAHAEGKNLTRAPTPAKSAYYPDRLLGFALSEVNQIRNRGGIGRADS